MISIDARTNLLINPVENQTFSRINHSFFLDESMYAEKSVERSNEFDPFISDNNNDNKRIKEKGNEKGKCGHREKKNSVHERDPITTTFRRILGRVTASTTPSPFNLILLREVEEGQKEEEEEEGG